MESDSSLKFRNLGSERIRRGCISVYSRPTHNIGQACIFCKKRHIRCNGCYPCDQCIKRDLECVYGVKTKRGPKPKNFLNQKNLGPVREEFKCKLGANTHDGTKEDLLFGGNDAYLALSPSSCNYEINTNKDPPMIYKASDLPQMESDFNLDDEEHLGELELAFKSFKKLVCPIVEGYIFEPNLEVAMQILNMKTINCVNDKKHLMEMFEHSVSACHGLRLINRPEATFKFAKYAKELLDLLLFRYEVHLQANLAKRVICNLVLLAYYYTGSNLNDLKQNVIMLAYQITSMHKCNIETSVRFSVNSMVMTLGSCDLDFIYWYAQANSTIPSWDSVSAVPLAVTTLMFVYLCLHPKGDFDKFRIKYSTQKLQYFLKRLEDTETWIPAKLHRESNPPDYDTTYLLGIMRSGCRSELFYLLEDFSNASLEARVTIENSINVRHSLIFLFFGIQSALEVSLLLNLRENLNIGLISLSRHTKTLPICARFQKKIICDLSSIDPITRNFSHNFGDTCPPDVEFPDQNPMYPAKSEGHSISDSQTRSCSQKSSGSISIKFDGGYMAEDDNLYMPIKAASLPSKKCNFFDTNAKISEPPHLPAKGTSKFGKSGPTSHKNSEDGKNESLVPSSPLKLVYKGLSSSHGRDRMNSAPIGRHGNDMCANMQESPTKFPIRRKELAGSTATIDSHDTQGSSSDLLNFSSEGDASIQSFRQSYTQNYAPPPLPMQGEYQCISADAYYPICNTAVKTQSNKNFVYQQWPFDDAEGARLCADRYDSCRSPPVCLNTCESERMHAGLGADKIKDFEDQMDENFLYDEKAILIPKTKNLYSSSCKNDNMFMQFCEAAVPDNYYIGTRVLMEDSNVPDEGKCP